MKTILPVSLLLLLLCAPAVCADATGDARAAIEPQYAALDAAAMAGDATVYARVCTPDCRFLQPGQPPATVTQLCRMMAQLLPQWKGMKVHTVIDTLAVTGRAAVVGNTQTTDGFFHGQPLHDVTVNKDTWTQTPQGWRLSLSEVVSDRMMPGAPPPPDPAQAQAVVARIKVHAVPLSTIDPAVPLDDLAPFGAAVGGARLVALGEASHGTREFFQMKHRLLEYLVEKKGFTVFALEANGPETAAVDRFVQTGQGDPKAALAGLYFWTWNTQEVLDLIRWMRAYNAAPGRHATLHFSGFDMQTPDVAMANVTAYLKRVRPADARIVGTDYAPLRKLLTAQAAARKAQKTPFPAPPPEAEAAACRAGTEAVVRLFDAHRSEYRNASSPIAFEDARQNAVVAGQAAKEMTFSPQSENGYRDRAMAENIAWLAAKKYPGQKIVLWAHNAHVGASGGPGPKSMGAYLRAAYGPKLYTLGFAFGSGEIRAVRMTDGQIRGRAVPLPVPAAQEGTGEALLHQAGLPLFLLDFRGVAPGDALGQWLAAPHPFRMPGAAWDPSAAALFAQPVTLRTAYDALIYVDVSHASRELPFPKRTAPTR